MTYLWIALGGALGAISRFGISNLMTKIMNSAFPYGTLSANLLGSLAIGIAYVLLVENNQGEGAIRLFLITGFLGAFTTFSTFSLESVSMLEQGRYAAFIAYILTSLTICLMATALGVVLTRQLT